MRSANFVVDGSADATVARLTAILQEFKQLLRVEIYSSIDFKVGINREALKLAIGLITELVKLDPRGGYYSQKHMEDAVGNSVQGEMEEFEKHVVETGFTKPQTIAVVGYKIRVMLSHLRIIHDSTKEGDDPSDFDDLYKMMKVPKEKQLARNSRRGARLKTDRPHPFINFRVQAEEDSDENIAMDDEDTEMIEVARMWCPVEYKAILLMSNGRQIFADTYTPTGDGFVTAKWFHDGSSLNLEVPEAAIQDYSLGNPIPAAAAPSAELVPAARKRKTGKPKAKGRGKAKGRSKAAAVLAVATRRMTRKTTVAVDAAAAQAFVAPEAGPEVAPAVSAASAHDTELGEPVKLMPRFGHGNSCTVIAMTKGDDKAQICYVSANMSKDVPNATPSSVCEQIISGMKDDIVEMVGPVISNTSMLNDLRAIATGIRGELLS